MKKINLYRYIGENQSIIVTPNQKHEKDTPHAIRLIADENHILVHGTKKTFCLDCKFEDENKWTEVVYNG